MAQVSRPFQVVLAAAVLFAVLWFFALRPKSDSGSSSAPPSPPAAQPAAPRQPGSSLPGGLGRSVGKADQARNQANQSAQASQRAAGNSSPTGTPAKPAPLTKAGPAAPASPGTPSARGTPTSSAPASPGAATPGQLLSAGVVPNLPGELAGKLGAGAVPARRAARPRHSAPARPHHRARGGASPGAVTAALARGKVVVLLFWNRGGSDDRLVHQELRRVSSHGGRAVIAAAPIGSVSHYSAVTNGVQVLQSPTVLIVDRRRRARLLVGFTDAAEIGQAVTEALRHR
jgi:hypothetical protein